MRQYMRIKFDRVIDPKRHYISPGGYDVELDSGKKIQFDYYDYWAYVDDEDPTILNIHNRIIDTESFPDAVGLSESVSNIAKINECFIYTGEPSEGDEEINPVEILAWTIDGVPIRRDVLEDYEF